MKPKYSKKLKKLMNSSGNLIGVAVCLALGLVFGIAAFEMSKTVNRGDTLENTVPFSAFEDKKVYAEADVHVMTDAFASGGKEFYYFILYGEDPMEIGILKAHELPEEADKMIMDGGASGTAAFSLKLKGMAMPIPADIRQFAIEGINKMVLGQNVVTKDNYSEYFGVRMLDATEYPEFSKGESLWFVTLMVSGFCFIFALIYMFVYGKSIYRLMSVKKNLSEETLRQLDSQLQEECTRYYPVFHTYLTRDFIAGNQQDGFFLLPYSDIKGLVREKMPAYALCWLSVTTSELKKVKLAFGTQGKKVHVLQNEIAQVIAQHISGATERGRYGTQETQENTSAQSSSSEHESDPVKDSLEVCQIHPVAGVFGALLFGLGGLLLWVIAGFFIAYPGIFGLMVSSFAMNGYRRFAGKQSIVVPVFLSLLLIPTADLLASAVSFAIAYHNAYPAEELFRYVTGNFLQLMEDFEYWDEFVKNLLIGYAMIPLGVLAERTAKKRI